MPQAESWIDKIVNAAVNNPWLLVVLTFALIGAVFYVIYLKYHRKHRQADLKTKKEIEQAKAAQTANLSTMAVVQAQGAKDIINGVSRLEDALKVAQTFVKDIRGCDECPKKDE